MFRSIRIPIRSTSRCLVRFFIFDCALIFANWKEKSFSQRNQNLNGYWRNGQAAKFV